MANSSGSRNRNYSSVSSSTRRSYNGRSRRRRNNNPAPLIAGGILVLVLALILVFITISKNKDDDEGHAANTETTAMVENISKEEIEHNAVIDLSEITGKDTMLEVRGMKPSEISKAITDMYDWSLTITNEDAKVGNVVKPTADANQTTEAATMGDA